MVLNAGIINVQKLLAGDPAGKKFAKIAVGTSNADVTGAETTLTGQVAKDITTIDYLGNGYLQFNSQLDAGDPAMNIQEMGIVADDGTLCYRTVITSVNKVAGVTYSISYKIRIQ